MGCNAAALPLPALLGIVTAAAQMRIKLGAAASEVLIGAVQEYLMHGKLSQGETCLLVWGMSELQQVCCCAQPSFAILHSCPLVWKKVVNSSCFVSWLLSALSCQEKSQGQEVHCRVLAPHSLCLPVCAPQQWARE